MLRKSYKLIALAVSIFAIFAATALADVYPQSSFTYDGFGGHYTGTCTTIIDNSGLKHNSCHGSLVSGAPVSQLTDISSGNLRGVVTPGGQVIEDIT